MKKQILPLLSLILLTGTALAQSEQTTMNHSMNMGESGQNTMNHSMNMAQMGGQGQNTAAAQQPTEAGNDAFGTIQEIITLLSNDPDTNWKEVNIEALRRHLVDMQDMTINVNVLSQKPIPNGLLAIVEPTTPRAAKALARVMKAHPAQLANETGWTMQVDQRGRQYALTTTTENPQEVDKIRGLGYIGLMAYGMHHQPHHWMMATGKNPHQM